MSVNDGGVTPTSDWQFWPWSFLFATPTTMHSVQDEEADSLLASRIVVMGVSCAS
jgi:hypothetical protein